MKPTRDQDLNQLIADVLRGDRRSLSRLISKVENDRDAARQAIRTLFPQTGRASVVGVTGPPGSGKSTLIAALVGELRKTQRKIAIVAIDPSSTFSGGALLGDRIRMKDLTEDPNVFIRSMATRGAMGGLCRAATDVVRILDAASWNYVIVETAGAGQTDLDIVELAKTVVVVLSPGGGDEIQAFKAGLMEIGDVFVVNKADMPSANRTLLDIRGMLQTYGSERPWHPQVLLTDSLKPTGMHELMSAIAEHQSYVAQAHVTRRGLAEGEAQLLAALREELEFGLIPNLQRSQAFAKYGKKITDRTIDPYTAALRLIHTLKRQ
ncbi:MAG: methylmalonyl Co-A mutase-associated GTPase MeaB [Candidatus Bathyarchaeia archaeon]